jgi:hypothetical protein
MSVLHEILDLPPQVTKSAFVVRLAEGVAHPDVLLDTYAITPDLHQAFDQALGLAGRALGERRNVAAFIHGSFGSGKSHFMGVLSLLLANHPRPWAQPELHDLLRKYEWVKTKRLLRLHFNLMGARSLDEKIFGEYLAQMEAAHPGAAIAPLFEDQALFDNAQALREKLGDEAFFAQLNAGEKADKRWGAKAATAIWDGARFDAARSSSASETRGRLFAALVKTLFPAFAAQSGAYLPFERGLAALGEHAAGLGYEGVVFFLDELILWLASGATNREWLNREIGKLAKLVDGQVADAPLPLMTFAARQRSIDDLVGEQYAGTEVQNVRDHLAWWEGRFDHVRLQDRNLPAIVEKRVVRAKNPEAKARLDAAFVELRRTLGGAWGTLLGELGDEAAFRQVYPFSPALVEALVAMSHYLQRERTALKVLVELLVEHLGDFEIGKVVSVGDLYDVLAGGEEPMDGTMRQRFAAAKRLYNNELLPVLQSQAGTTSPERCQRLRDDHPPTLGCSNCRETRCRADNRLIKTLLLAALVPNCSVFRGLTVSRLVQLNHGTLKSPVPGAEAQQAAGRLRAWAKDGKVRLGEQLGDPTVSIALDGVDLRPILESARLTYDKSGFRRAKIREVLFEVMGLASQQNIVDHVVPWRGIDRKGLVQYGNVREMDDESLRPRAGDDFKVVIDYPFDDAGRTPQEDLARVEQFGEQHDAHTVVWLPSFFAEAAQRDLTDLVVLDSLLVGDAWKAPLAHLRPEDQQLALNELRSRQTHKRKSVERVLHAAYGLAMAEPGMLDASRSVDQHFVLLMRGETIHGLAAATLKDAVSEAVRQLLMKRFPRHPQFEDKVTRGKLDKQLDLLQRVVEAEGQRLPLAKNERDTLHFAEILQLVGVTDAHALHQPVTFQAAENALRARNLEPPTVADVREAFDAKERGLTEEVADFVVMAFALATGRELVAGGVPLREPTLGRLPKDALLPKPPMPEPASWQRALDRAAGLFGVSLGGRALHAKNLRALSDRLAAKRDEATVARAGHVGELLERRRAFFSGESPRLRTAKSAALLLRALEGDALVMVAALGAFTPETSEAAMQRHLLNARKVADALSQELTFQVFEALRGRPEPEANELLVEVARTLEADELQVELAAKLSALALAAQRVLAGPVVELRTPERGAGPPVAAAALARGGTSDPSALDGERARMLAALEAAGPGAELLLNFTWEIRRRP